MISKKYDFGFGSSAQLGQLGQPAENIFGFRICKNQSCKFVNFESMK